MTNVNIGVITYCKERLNAYWKSSWEYKNRLKFILFSHWVCCCWLFEWVGKLTFFLHFFFCSFLSMGGGEGEGATMIICWSSVFVRLYCCLLWVGIAPLSKYCCICKGICAVSFTREVLHQTWSSLCGSIIVQQLHSSAYVIQEIDRNVSHACPNVFKV